MAEMGYSDRKSAPGEPSAAYSHAVYGYEHTPAYQAEALVKHHVLARAGGRLSLSAWYRVDDLPPGEGVIGDEHNRHLGILDVAGAPKPAFWALRHLAQLFAGKVRSLDGRIRVERAAGSESEVHAFERKDGTMLVFGWLRSPPVRDEAAAPAEDPRREVVSVILPRGGGRLSVRTAVGDPAASGARLAGSVLSGVELTGDRVFVGVIAR
jgi:hypothetical protein